MNTLACGLASDKAYTARLAAVPDAAEATDEKLLAIASEAAWFSDVVQKFNAIMRNYGKSGFMVCGEIYKSTNKQSGGAKTAAYIFSNIQGIVRNSFLTIF